MNNIHTDRAPHRRRPSCCCASVPDAILVAPGHEADLSHVLMLAQRRGVEVHEHPDGAYALLQILIAP